MPDPATLSAALAEFGAYPADHPQTLADLLDADPDTISHPLAWWLRRQAVEVSRASERHHINSPKDAMRLLRNNYALHPWTGKWTAYALDERRQLVYVPHARGGVTPLRHHSPLIPKAEDLPRLPRARGGDRQPSWLVLFGGDPQVLSKKGVARGLSTLQRRLPVADVLFFQRDVDAGVPPTLWSVKAGVGVRENGSPQGERVLFPDPEALETARGDSDRRSDS